MDFWSEFSKTITTAADQTVKGAEKLTDMAKVKYRIASQRGKLDECYRTIGKLRMAEARGETVTEQMYAGLIEQASALEEQLSALEEKLSELREDTVCPQCSYRIKHGLNYCPKCGAPLSGKTPE